MKVFFFNNILVRSKYSQQFKYQILCSKTISAKTNRFFSRALLHIFQFSLLFILKTDAYSNALFITDLQDLVSTIR